MVMADRSLSKHGMTTPIALPLFAISGYLIYQGGDLGDSQPQNLPGTVGVEDPVQLRMGSLASGPPSVPTHGSPTSVFLS
jgi:hypothetical protein